MSHASPSPSATPSTFKHPLELALEAVRALEETGHVTLTQRPLLLRVVRLIHRAIRDILIKEQQTITENAGAPLFLPHDGFCYRCRADLLEGVRIGQQRHMITGCPQCLVSFCD